MSLHGRGVCGALRVTPIRLQRNLKRVVIPRLPSQSTKTAQHGVDPAARGSEGSSRRASEYHENKHIPPYTSQFLDREGADSLLRQQQLMQFSKSTEAEVEQVWRDSKSHLRKQQALISEFGVEGAVRETLDPSRTSFNETLRSRPLDRAILEEIYLGLHGRRIERRLKKGVSWEHWITKGDGTAPVYTTSRKGQQTFAFGGQLKQVGKATHPLQFPVLTVPGKEALLQSSRGRPGSPQGGRRGSRKFELVDREVLVPEVAFVGRTSSGKSSLINAIVNASIAPYGHLQGTTSALHFYSVAGKVMLVDCPGYGYYNPLETPRLDAENAVKAMRAYLRTGARRGPEKRGKTADDGKADTASSSFFTSPPEEGEHESDDPSFDDPQQLDGREGEEEAASPSRAARTRVQPRNLKRVFLCVPARGMQHADLEYCRMLEHLGIPFSVVLTKTDAAPIRMLARLTDYTRCQLVQFNQCKELMLASSLRLAGIDKMQSLIGGMAVTEDRMDGATMDFSSIV